MFSIPDPDRHDTARDLLALTKPRVTALVVLTAAAGWALAPASRGLGDLAYICGAIALLVGSANVLNCWWERDVDRFMVRTRNRPLPSGRIRARTALLFGLSLGAVALALLAYTTNVLTTALGLFALVVYVVVYTPLKQRSPLALSIGAIPGALPPVMGWTAVTNRLDETGLALFALLFFWQLPHFLAIALFRRDDYQRAGLQVLPNTHGEHTAQVRMVVYSVLLVVASLVFFPLEVADLAYATVATTTGVAFVWLACVAAKGHLQMGRVRRVFLASLVYLPILLLTLILDRHAAP